MPSAVEEYEKLKRLAQDQSRGGGKVDPKVMADKAAAHQEVINEERKRNKDGGHVVERQVVSADGTMRTEKFNAPSKRSLQERYISDLPERVQASAKKRLLGK